MFVLLIAAFALFMFFRKLPTLVRTAGLGADYATWNRTVRGHAREVHTPHTQDELVALVKRAASEGLKVRAIGSGHSWNGGISTKDILVSLDSLNRVVAIDRTAMLVTVQAGKKLKDLNKELDNAQLALSVLGSISEQSVGGILSTGTHGTGVCWLSHLRCMCVGCADGNCCVGRVS